MTCISSGMMMEDTMSTSEGLWSRLPDEICERVLSFLPVPALCRCRSVCKIWNELLRKPRFLDLCDLNGRNEAYLCVTRHGNSAGWCWVDKKYRRTTYFLDVDEKRWYSIPTDASLLAPTNDNVPRLLSMHDGLICELSALPSTDEEYNIVMFDPVAKLRRELPTSTYDDGPVFCLVGNYLPTITTTVDNATRTFKVFIVNNHTLMPHQSRVSVYESSTGAWRFVRNPPERLESSQGMLELSAVFFQGNLYAISWHKLSRTVIVFSFNLEENLWREVLVEDNPNLPGYPTLVVNSNRLFMGMWSKPRDKGHDSDDTMFEIKEILVDVKSSRLVVQISSRRISQMFDEPHWNELQFALTDGFPLTSHSVVLISGSSGKLMAYDVRSQSFGALPAHPLELREQDPEEVAEGDTFWPLYRAKLMNLRLRNIL